MQHVDSFWLDDETMVALSKGNPTTREGLHWLREGAPNKIDTTMSSAAYRGLAIGHTAALEYLRQGYSLPDIYNLLDSTKLSLDTSSIIPRADETIGAVCIGIITAQQMIQVVVPQGAPRTFFQGVWEANLIHLARLFVRARQRGA